MNAAGSLQAVGQVQTCCRAIPPLTGSTAGYGRGLPHTGLSHTSLHHLRLRCSLVPLWHSCWSRHGCSFLSPCRDFLYAAKGRSRHQGRRELWWESRDRGHNLGPGHGHAGSGLRGQRRGRAEKRRGGGGKDKRKR